MVDRAETNERARARARKKILDAAIEIFDDRGVAGSSIERITDRAGVAQGLANYHFGSKDQLISAVINLWFETRFVIRESKGNGDELLADFIDDSFVATSYARPLQRVVAAMKLQPHTHLFFARVEEKYSKQQMQVEDEIRGVFRRRGAHDPAIEEIMLRTLLEGVVATEAAYGNSFPLEESRRWVYERYGLPAPADPLPINPSMREENPRLRAMGAVRSDT
ncbi:TetR/AcrR family transcriptional regulator [uncultured Microbacterium sp.]|uniref:TetR/AcrR family transcriptional regulator n=1 Tax=uncultured Microbacterium sp. TaxID=191216 RepID=UPI0025DC8118|nr:TetR/AcrR family transcriptional regulator [uncultured Microbacterium sp.]